MRTFDRHGVHIERCDGCQGIFLDRGELERIVEAEKRHYSSTPPPDPQAPPPSGGYVPQGQPRPGYPTPGYPDSPRGYRPGYPDSPRGYSDSPRPYRRRRKSFLEDLFD
ncbi:zf-TFIIB domain-containing protein [Nocardiopsis sp. MT53]|nr:zf-TFIIB domain-containing protein [Nocardiopsis sp. MT53]